MSTKESQYAGFDEWWAESGGNNGYTESFARATWMAASYRMEALKDKAFTEINLQRTKRIQKLEVSLEVRKEVHRDDYRRAAILIGGLTLIYKKGGEAGKIALSTLETALKNYRDK